MLQVAGVIRSRAQDLALEPVLVQPPEVLVEQPSVGDGLVAVACASRSLTSALVQDPTLVDVLRHLPDPTIARFP